MVTVSSDFDFRLFMRRLIDSCARRRLYSATSTIAAAATSRDCRHRRRRRDCTAAATPPPPLFPLKLAWPRARFDCAALPDSPPPNALLRPPVELGSLLEAARGIGVSIGWLIGCRWTSCWTRVAVATLAGAILRDLFRFLISLARPILDFPIQDCSAACSASGSLACSPASYLARRVYMAAWPGCSGCLDDSVHRRLDSQDDFRPLPPPL